MFTQFLSLCFPVDDALEQFLAAVSSKVKGRRSEPRKRVIYKPRRMSCGAPSVTRLSFTDEDRLRFEREWKLILIIIITVYIGGCVVGTRCCI